MSRATHLANHLDIQPTRMALIDNVCQQEPVAYHRPLCVERGANHLINQLSAGSDAAYATARPLAVATSRPPMMARFFMNCADWATRSGPA